jgi:hypothetical protein
VNYFWTTSEDLGVDEDNIKIKVMGYGVWTELNWTRIEYSDRLM